MKVIFSIVIAVLSTVTAMSSSAGTIHSLRNGYSPLAFAFDTTSKKVNVASSEESKEIAVAFLEKEVDQPKVDQPKIEIIVAVEEVTQASPETNVVPSVDDVPPEEASVSEPGSIGLMMLGAVMLLGFRKSRTSV